MALAAPCGVCPCFWADVVVVGLQVLRGVPAGGHHTGLPAQPAALHSLDALP